MAKERYDINAKMPAGVSPEKMPEMMQALLSDRFGIQLHRERKEMPVYALLVGKPPLRMQKSVIDPNAPPPTAVQVTGTGSAAGVSVNLATARHTRSPEENSRPKVSATGMAAARALYRPPDDGSHQLKGTYDFEFTVTPEDTQTLMIRAAINAGYSCRNRRCGCSTTAATRSKAPPNNWG